MDGMLDTFTVVYLSLRRRPRPRIRSGNCFRNYEPIFGIEPSWREKSYIEFLEEDRSEGKKESFGLFDALKEDEFSQQFLTFAGSQASDLSKFPLVYDFVKYRIWSVIVHQQQIEGMFNKYDIKTDSNQEKALQEARMQLSCSTSVETTVTRETLKEVRKEIRKEESEKKEEEELGDEAAKIILKAYIASKK